MCKLNEDTIMSLNLLYFLALNQDMSIEELLILDMLCDFDLSLNRDWRNFILDVVRPPDLVWLHGVNYVYQSLFT